MSLGKLASLLRAEGYNVNHIHFKWIYPIDEEKINEILSKCEQSIIVECNYTGQFARFLRGETGFKADGHIRKYDGEPFMPHHIVDGAKEIEAGKTELYIPYQEIVV